MNNIKNNLLQGLLIACLFITTIANADHASPSFETGAAGAIMTTPGATLPRGEVVFGFAAQFIELDDISDAELETLGLAHEDVHSVDNLLNLSANFAYGFTDDFTAGISFPYIERNNIREAHHDHDSGLGEAEFAGDSKGIGDISLFGQYRFYRSDNQDVALLAGVELPSGETKEHGIEGHLFEAEQQPGSGSVDPFVGLAMNHNLGRAGFSANILYTFTNEGTQQTELGDIFNYNLALSYRAYSPEGTHDHHHHQHAFNLLDYVDLSLELNGDYREKVEINGMDEKHSGGHTLFISPGLRVGLAHRLSFYTSVGVPLINDYNGQQSEPDYRIIGGFSAIF